MMQTWDVIVVGGGNAALCAALSARESTQSVLVLERAPEAEAGGNSRLPRGSCASSTTARMTWRN